MNDLQELKQLLFKTQANDLSIIQVREALGVLESAAESMDLPDYLFTPGKETSNQGDFVVEASLQGRDMKTNYRVEWTSLIGAKLIIDVEKDGHTRRILEKVVRENYDLILSPHFLLSHLMAPGGYETITDDVK